MPATNRASALGLRKTCSATLGAWVAIANLRFGRLRYRYAKSQRQKSARSRDRRIARQAQRNNEKSKKMIVSAARIRTSTASWGPRSPSIIHRSPTTSCSCIAIHFWRGVAISPGCQKILSTSVTGSPVRSPKCLARVDLPDAPRPTMSTRFMLFILRRKGFGAKVAGSSMVLL